MTGTWSQQSPFGVVTVEVSGAGVRRVSLAGAGGTEAAPVEGAPAPAPAHPVAAAIDAYLAGELDALAGLEVDLAGRSRFSWDVLSALRAVPPGAVTTYAELARAVGRPAASRAVGQAVGANPLLLVVPCHRVVASGGTLGGYSAGLDLKRRLLAHEGVSPLAGGWPPRRRNPQGRESASRLVSSTP